MNHIRLITFDLFGTLADWQSYVEQAFPGRYGIFRRAMAERQEPGRATFPYRNLLYEVGMDLGTRGPRPAREELSFFADSLGFAKPFADSRAVQFLSHMAMTGAVSNCDVRHLVDVQKTLGVVFDVTCVAEDLRAYKPYPEAWDAIHDLVTKKLGFDRRSWLHVSAFADTDLAPAKERGVATCFLPRPGGSEAAEAESIGPDYSVSDLWQLARLVAEVNGAPVRYEVTATTRTPEIAADFSHWLRYDHGPELLAVRACQSFQLLRLGPTTMRCEYIFTNKAALEDYLKGPALEMRRKGRERYSEQDVTFERSDSELEAGYCHRERLDFHGRRAP
jgi:putative hydrolase of the HAD superfamily